MKNKIRKFINENKWILITFLVATITISVIYILNKVAPFGNNSLLTIDFYHQYGPMLNELVDRIRSGETLLYSFNTGGGIPFYRNFSNYLSSPFNLILLLFNGDNIIMAFSVVIGLKVVFAASFMSYFLKKVFKKDSALLVVFSILYAFSGYFCAYYWNIMWLDGIVFLPIIALGIIRLINDKKPLLYIFSLAIMLFSNYFIAYMICIFSSVFFVGYFIYKGNFKLKNILKTFLMFFISSILAASLVAFALIPLYKALSTISATSDVFPEFKFSFNVLKFYFNHLTGVNQTTFASDKLPLPNVYCGIISLVSIIMLFFNKNIKLKTKIFSLLILISFLFIFNCSWTDFIMHAFHVPNDLPYRYSFIYVFLVVTLAFYSFSNLKEIKPLFIYIAFGILSIFIFLSVKLNFENIDSTRAIICFVFLLCYLLIVILYLNNDKKNIERLTSFIFILFAVVESIYGINVNWDINHDIKTFLSDRKPYKYLISEIKKDDNGLYRMEKTNSLTLNDGSWYDYYGISTFSSMAYESVAKTQRKLGMSGNNINSYYYQYYQTPIYNTMFNVKYLLGNYIDNDYYTLIDINSKYNAVKYDYAYSIGFLIDKKIKDLNLISDDPFYNQSNFVKLLNDNKEVYNSLEVSSVLGGKIITSADGRYYISCDEVSKKLIVTLLNDKTQNLYLYLNGSNINGYTINGTYYSVSSDEYYTVDTGLVRKGEVSLEIDFSSSGNGITLLAKSINDDVFKEFTKNVSKGKLDVKSYSETSITGIIKADEDKAVYTSIAYDPGFSVYVDNKKVDTYKVLDGYLAFDVSKGSHNIKIKYYPVGLKLGLVISFISFCIISGYVILNTEKITKNQKKVK